MGARDDAGKLLTDYPRPSVAVDTAVLTVPPGGPLSVVLVPSGDRWALPGTFLHEGELLVDAAARALRTKAGLTDTLPRQLSVFDALDRDDRGRVLSVAHLVGVAWDRLELVDGTRVVPVGEVGPLRWDHSQIIERAVGEMRRAYRRSPDPYRLLGEPFSLRELQTLHESVAGRLLMRDAFRRLMEPQVVPTGELARGTVGKPARSFVRRR